MCEREQKTRLKQLLKIYWHLKKIIILMFEMNLSYNLGQFIFFSQKANENIVFTK